MVSAFSSMVHLHSKTNCFSVDASILWCHKVLLFLYTSAIHSSKDGMISSYVDSTGSFRGYHYLEKRMNNSTKFLGLDGVMLMSILRKLLKLLMRYFNIMWWICHFSIHKDLSMKSRYILTRTVSKQLDNIRYERLSPRRSGAGSSW